MVYIEVLIKNNNNTVAFNKTLKMIDKKYNIPKD